MFQHTAARRRLGDTGWRTLQIVSVSTHSRPKAAGDPSPCSCCTLLVSTHSRPKAAGFECPVCQHKNKFQHTAARRRLVLAAREEMLSKSFNTQPPEGGWDTSHHWKHTRNCFNTQPPEGGWVSWSRGSTAETVFQHTAARRRLASCRVNS